VEAGAEAAVAAEHCPLALERPAVDERSAARDEPVVIEHHDPMAPVATPVPPSPREAREDADAERRAEHDTRAGDVEAGIPVPARPQDDRCAVHDPRIVLRDVDHLRALRLDLDL